MANDIQRLSSRNHAIKTIIVEKNHAIIELAEKEKLGLNGKDFILYFRDAKLEDPAVFMNVSSDNQECAMSISIIPNLRPLKLKQEFFSRITKTGPVDSDPKTIYEKI
jgi:hypothetical protein